MVVLSTGDGARQLKSAVLQSLIAMSDTPQTQRLAMM
jgi:hypothetical protein